MNGFEFVQNESVRNLNDGIYPTLSANGLVQNNVSYGSLDIGDVVAGSENVRVIGNEAFGSTIGFEITVSNNVWVTHNKMHGNTLGIGLFHPNGAGNPPKPVMKNWVIEQNDVRDNNLPNPAVPGTFQSALPPGIGILLAGVSDHVIEKNTVVNNDFVGSRSSAGARQTRARPDNCTDNPPIADPAANRRHGLAEFREWQRQAPPIPIAFLAADITYFEFEGSSGNSLREEPAGRLHVRFLTADGLLPTDGCRQCRAHRW